MTNNPWNNDRDFVTPPKASWWSSRVTLIVILALAVFVGLIVFWNLVISHTDDVDESNIPVVAAETLTLKERPQMTTIEEGDSVYSLISQEKSKAASLKTDTEEPVYETSFQPLEKGEVPEVVEETTEVIDVKTVSTQRPPKQAPKKAPEGIFFLQVGSLPSEEGARAESGRLQKKYKPLQDLSIKIVAKELPGKGTYHRLHAGPFGTADEATKACQQLTKLGANCLVTK
jgi:cell division protein FtsN